MTGVTLDEFVADPARARRVEYQWRLDRSDEANVAELLIRLSVNGLAVQAIGMSDEHPKALALLVWCKFDWEKVRPPDPPAPLLQGVVVDDGRCTIRYTVELSVTMTDPERAAVELDRFLWRALFSGFGDLPVVTRGDVRVLYDSYGDDMGHHEGHDQAVILEPLTTPEARTMVISGSATCSCGHHTNQHNGGTIGPDGEMVEFGLCVACPCREFEPEPTPEPSYPDPEAQAIARAYLGEGGGGPYHENAPCTLDPLLYITERLDDPFTMAPILANTDGLTHLCHEGNPVALCGLDFTRFLSTTQPVRSGHVDGATCWACVKAHAKAVEAKESRVPYVTGDEDIDREIADYIEPIAQEHARRVEERMTRELTEGTTPRVDDEPTVMMWGDD